MLHDDYTAAAALLQNDPQEGLRRLMELFGGPVHAICTAILRGHAEDADVVHRVRTSGEPSASIVAAISRARVTSVATMSSSGTVSMT